MYTERTTYGPFGPRPSESHLGPWPRWRNLSGRQWSLDWRLSLFLLDLRLHNVIVALDTNRGWTCAHIYVHLRTYRIIRDLNNSRSWNFDHNNLNNSRSLKKIFIFGIANYFNQYGRSTWNGKATQKIHQKQTTVNIASIQLSFSPLSPSLRPSIPPSHRYLRLTWMHRFRLALPLATSNGGSYYGPWPVSYIAFT